MTTTAMVLWIVITTIYGWIMYNRGGSAAVRDLVDMQQEAGIFKDKKEMYKKMHEYYSAQEDEEG